MAIYDPRNMIDQLDIISISEGPNYVEQNLVLPFNVAERLWSKEVQFYIFMLVLATSLYAVVQTQNNT